MEPGNHHDNMEQRLDDLAREIERCHKEISSLRSDINLLAQSGVQVRKPIPNKQHAPKTVPGLENFVGLKLIHFVGIIVLIAGLSIGVKYAIDINLITPTLRIVLTYLAGAVLFVLSLRLKRKYEVLSMIFFSGAMATFYFTTYAAFTYYNMIHQLPAFLIMLLLTIFTVYHALRYNRQEIAILGLVGAYAIPFFVSSNSGNVAGLFAYVFIINAGILYLSLKKYWPSLTYIAFISSWLLLFVSRFGYFQEGYLNTYLVFSFALYAMFLVASLGIRLIKKQPVGNFEKVMVISNSLLLYLAILMLFFEGNQVKIATLTFVIVYSVAGFFGRKYLANQKKLGDIFLGIAILAFTAYLPMQFNGLATTIIYGLAAVALFITGMLTGIKTFRVGAIFLFVVSIVKLLVIDSERFTSVQKIIAWIFTGIILLVVSFLYQRFRERIFGADE